MEQIERYLLSVIAAALIVGIIRALPVSDGKMGGLIRMAAGLFAAIVILRPVGVPRLPDPEAYFRSFEDRSREAAEAGECFAEETRKAFIKTRAEAYILDKAETLGAQIQAEVILGKEMLPEQAILRGDAVTDTKQEIIRRVTEDLGIKEENVRWIG